jgi:hypothetical protein
MRPYSIEAEVRTTKLEERIMTEMKVSAKRSLRLRRFLFAMDRIDDSREKNGIPFSLRLSFRNLGNIFMTIRMATMDVAAAFK